MAIGNEAVQLRSVIDDLGNGCHEGMEIGILFSFCPAMFHVSDQFSDISPAVNVDLVFLSGWLQVNGTLH